MEQPTSTRAQLSSHAIDVNIDEDDDSTSLCSNSSSVSEDEDMPDLVSDSDNSSSSEGCFDTPDPHMSSRLAEDSDEPPPLLSDSDSDRDSDSGNKQGPSAANEASRGTTTRQSQVPASRLRAGFLNARPRPQQQQQTPAAAVASGPRTAPVARHTAPTARHTAPVAHHTAPVAHHTAPTAHHTPGGNMAASEQEDSEEMPELVSSSTSESHDSLTDLDSEEHSWSDEDMMWPPFLFPHPMIGSSFPRPPAQQQQQRRRQANTAAGGARRTEQGASARDATRHQAQDTPEASNSSGARSGLRRGFLHNRGLSDHPPQQPEQQQQQQCRQPAGRAHTNMPGTNSRRGLSSTHLPPRPHTMHHQPEPFSSPESFSPPQTLPVMYHPVLGGYIHLPSPGFPGPFHVSTPPPSRHATRGRASRQAQQHRLRHQHTVMDSGWETASDPEDEEAAVGMGPQVTTAAVGTGPQVTTAAGTSRPMGYRAASWHRHGPAITVNRLRPRAAASSRTRQQAAPSHVPQPAEVSYRGHHRLVGEGSLVQLPPVLPAGGHSAGDRRAEASGREPQRPAAPESSRPFSRQRSNAFVALPNSSSNSSRRPEPACGGSAGVKLDGLYNHDYRESATGVTSQQDDASKRAQQRVEQLGNLLSDSSYVLQLLQGLEGVDPGHVSVVEALAVLRGKQYMPVGVEVLLHGPAGWTIPQQEAQRMRQTREARKLLSRWQYLL